MLNIATYDDGGAGRAAVRIMKSLQQVGVQSKLLVREKKTDEKNVEEVCNTPLLKFEAKVKGAINTIISHDDIMYELAGFDTSKKRIVEEADIIILHWTNHFLSNAGVNKLLRLNKPIIWVMHDMWLLTGGCHCDRYCGKYKSGCKDCTYNGKKIIKSYKYFNIKKKIISKSNLHIITPSNWLMRRVKESAILCKQNVDVIHNPIDVEKYYIVDDIDFIKEKYQIPIDKKIIMYGACNADTDFNKGYRYFKEAVKYLDSDKYHIVLFGTDNTHFFRHDFEQCTILGKIRSNQDLVEIINCADVMVVPSDQENYSNTVLESQCCGVPVVAFSIGGMPDLIEHKQNGYLAKYQDINDLAEGMNFCANNKEAMVVYTRNKVKNTNSFSLVGNSYKMICEKLLNE
ncbi:MAG: glycosyltransferase [Lachnospiraceae bacterium]|nr:glycosyltransferase [Lachnospiraceae bacterium]